ncbi:hypothetical protein NL54_12980 [Pantoea stewartii]|nr:hypothetical protein NL54_12980 [Pantoea stewartii]KHN58567.1 hypothetical protein OI73_21655 [Pantoea stewartii]
MQSNKHRLDGYLVTFQNEAHVEVFILECLGGPALPAFFSFSFTDRGLASVTARETALMACFLFAAY